MKPVFKDVEFLTAKDKTLVLKAWVAFLKSGLAREKFTDRLYKFLTLYADFIAHFDVDGFYNVYFAIPGEKTIRFLHQFDPDGPGVSAERSSSHWRTDTRYHDISEAMREAARPFVAKLMETARNAERERDLATARALLAKHGEK